MKTALLSGVVTLPFIPFVTDATRGIRATRVSFQGKSCRVITASALGSKAVSKGLHGTRDEQKKKRWRTQVVTNRSSPFFLSLVRFKFYHVKLKLASLSLLCLQDSEKPVKDFADTKTAPLRKDSSSDGRLEARLRDREPQPLSPKSHGLEIASRKRNIYIRRPVRKTDPPSS